MKFEFKQRANGTLYTEFPVEVVEIHKEILKNEDGTRYRVADIMFENADGVMIRSQAMLYTHHSAKAGCVYLANANILEDKALTRIIPNLKPLR